MINRRGSKYPMKYLSAYSQPLWIRMVCPTMTALYMTILIIYYLIFFTISILPPPLYVPNLFINNAYIFWKLFTTSVALYFSLSNSSIEWVYWVGYFGISRWVDLGMKGLIAAGILLFFVETVSREGNEVGSVGGIGFKLVIMMLVDSGIFGALCYLYEQMYQVTETEVICAPPIGKNYALSGCSTYTLIQLQ